MLRTMKRRPVVVIMAMTLVSMMLWIPVAGAATETIVGSQLRATFTYHGTYPQSKDARLTIWKSGTVIYDEKVHSSWCGSECWPNSNAGPVRVLHIVHLSSSGDAAVVLDLFSGGAHCCAIEQVFSIGATSHVTRREHNFGNPGVRLVKLGSGATTYFLSANDAFAYEFTDYAASGMPIEILSFSHSSFHNVTKNFPRLIAGDAAQWMRAFKSQASSKYQDSVGVIAAWAADEDMLGHSRAVATFLSAQASAGHLRSALDPVVASGKKFVVALQAFLRRQGYATQ